MSASRVRWSALGAAVAVSMGAGGLGIAQGLSSGTASAFTPVIPCRLLDTRVANDVRSVPIGARESFTIAAAGSCGIPAGATGLSVNLTSVGATARSFLTLYPTGVTLPEASHLNPSPQLAVSTNGVDLALSGSGSFDVYNFAGKSDLVIDVLGYYTGVSTIKGDPGTPGTPGPAKELWYIDQDGDGYGSGSDFKLAVDAPAGYVDNKNDCDDDDATVNVDCSGVYVAFNSDGSNLVPGDTNGETDVFVKDTRNGEIMRVNTTSTGVQANNSSYEQAMSADGIHVAFTSYADNLVPDDTNDSQDVFVKNIVTGEIVRASTDGEGAEVNGTISSMSISADGIHVAFASGAANLVPDDTNDSRDVFVKNIETGEIVRANTDAENSQAAGWSDETSISADGTVVAFASSADNLVADDMNETQDVFVKNIVTGEIVRASTGEDGGESNRQSDSPSISADGTVVAFASSADNLVEGDMNGSNDVFVKNLSTNTIVRANTDASGREGTNGWYSYSFDPSISADGTKVAFISDANNLVDGDMNYNYDGFLKNLATGEIVRVSTDSTGAEANANSREVLLSADSTLVAFSSDADNLGGGDRYSSNVFVKDLNTNKTTLLSANATGTAANSDSYLRIGDR